MILIMCLVFLFWAWGWACKDLRDMSLKKMIPTPRKSGTLPPL